MNLASLIELLGALWLDPKDAALSSSTSSTSMQNVVDDVPPTPDEHQQQQQQSNASTSTTSTTSITSSPIDEQTIDDEQLRRLRRKWAHDASLW